MKKFRIIYKGKNSVKLVIRKNIIEMPWITFNRLFENPKNGVYAKVTEATSKEYFNLMNKITRLAKVSEIKGPEDQLIESIMTEYKLDGVSLGALVLSMRESLNKNEKKVKGSIKVASTVKNRPTFGDLGALKGLKFN